MHIIVISIILNLATLVYNIACIALSNLSYIITVRKAEFNMKHNIATYQDDGFQDQIHNDMNQDFARSLDEATFKRIYG